MIDFEKELNTFHFLELDKELTEIKHEGSIFIQAFNTMLKKFRKEQNEANYQLEEAMGMLEEIKNKGQSLEELKESLKSTEEEKMNLVNSLISVLDHFEEYYKYVQNYASEAWIDQFSVLWNNVSNILLTQGIFRIEGENTTFDPKLNVAKMTSSDKNLPDGIITEVVKCGYMYKSNVLRKAEVIVNKTGYGGEIDGQNYRY